MGLPPKFAAETAVFRSGSVAVLGWFHGQKAILLLQNLNLSPIRRFIIYLP